MSCFLNYQEEENISKDNFQCKERRPEGDMNQSKGTDLEYCMSYSTINFSPIHVQ